MVCRSAFILLIALAMLAGGCRKNKAVNPIANLDSKQPDKVLFDRSVELLKRNRFDQARMTLQTLINTYPDSEYVARAKLTVADAWYHEGGSVAMAQAEAEYKDFITFFPNMPEAAEAQLKVAGIHYKQMQKPDRDFTHAKRAEDEYRQLVLQFPDSKLVPEAKAKLLEVQEVLAEREFRIGRFYYLRESFPAAIARLRSMVDSYPLYSQADEALYLLGQSYEGQMEVVRLRPFNEVQKARLLRELENNAAAAYKKLISRYPVMDRAGDAKARLAELKQPVPEPSPDAVALNKAEEESRGELGKWGRMMGALRGRPDVSSTSKVGEPALQDARPTNATDVVKDLSKAAEGGTSSATVETVKAGPTENQPVPRSDSGTATATPQDKGPAETGIPELKPTEPNPPEQGSDPALAPAPMPVNDAAASTTAKKAEAKEAESSSKPEADKNKESTSKKKKKKGLGKLNPF